MLCEFEEKQFEKLMDFELFDSLRLFPAGQVFEGRIGIDSAGFTHNRYFWRLFGRFWFFPPWGMPLGPELWDLRREDIDTDTFPSFRCNVFLQYKRPQHISSKLAPEYSDWKQNYYRYDINQRQQKILESLENNVSRDALVLYACPSFWKFGDLWNHTGNSQLVTNTNFAKASRISGHKRYSFINAGAAGKAHSESEEVEAVNLKEEINKLMKQEKHFGKNSDFIFALNNSINEMWPLVEKTYSFDIEEFLKETDFSGSKLAKSLMKISLFTFVTQLSWMIGCVDSART